MKISEVKGAVTLEQLKQMDGQRVLVPETCNLYGGFGMVDTVRERVDAIDDNIFFGSFRFSDYGKTWIAVADPCGILEVEE